MAYAVLGLRCVAAILQEVPHLGKWGRVPAQQVSICADTTPATSPGLLAVHVSRQSMSL